MASTRTQTFSTHRKFVPLYHFVVVPILLINLLRALWLFVSSLRAGFSFEMLLQALMAFAFLAMALHLRLFALRAQDRVIRLEEQLRLQRLLAEELHDRIAELRTGQLVALRFASDEEVPDLAQRIWGGELKSQDEIKRAIQRWRPDYRRV